MPLLTRLKAITRLLWLTQATTAENDPLDGPPLELVTEDGLYLLTEDGNYLGVING